MLCLLSSPVRFKPLTCVTVGAQVGQNKSSLVAELGSYQALFSSLPACYLACDNQVTTSSSAPPSAGAIAARLRRPFLIVCVYILTYVFLIEKDPNVFTYLTGLFFQKVLSDAMSESTGLPLDIYTKSTPPGWRPGLLHYPYRKFLEKLRLWYRLTDLDATQVGPAVAGRLQGRPYNMAMALRMNNRVGTELSGDAALSYPGEPEQVDPSSGAVLQPAIESGLQRLIRTLARRYGADSQQTATGLIDIFVDLRRGRMSLLDYLNEFEHT